jgi:hypothetical protein
MKINGWKYYNHAAIPTTAPHEKVDVSPLKDKSVWKMDGKPYFARWTTDFDCGYETLWWYCIKDTPFDISKLNSKRRYEINKGKKNFEIRVIDPVEYVEDIIRIQQLAWANYPAAYKPESSPSLRKRIDKWRSYCVFGAFRGESNELSGYALIRENESWANFAVLKVVPECERLAINAAMVAAILEYYNDRFENGFYISDGERNIVHVTAFQNYLVKYFDFRKAYCKLNLLYRKPVGLYVKVLMPFRKLIKKFNTNPLFSKVSSVLLMESIIQSQR